MFCKFMAALTAVFVSAFLALHFLILWTLLA